MASKNLKTKYRVSPPSSNTKKRPSSSHSSSRIFEEVVGLAETLLHSRKAYGADKLQSVAEATRRYAASMSNLPTISEQINVASETMEDFADYIVHNNVEQMIEDAGTFARRKPLTTLCVTVAAGLAASRLLMPIRRESNIGGKKFSGGQKKATATRQGTNGSAHLHA